MRFLIFAPYSFLWGLAFAVLFAVPQSYVLAQPVAQTGLLTDSNLPIVVLDTDGVRIPNEPRIPALMGVINNGDGERNRLVDPYNEYDGHIGIELRGSSSQMFPKKQYRIETVDAEGENNNVSLLGLPEENDWVLNAPYSDKALIRNVLAYRLARDMGHYAPRTRFCEVMLNGEYQGVYVLIEKIKRDKNRVAIKKLDEDDTEGDALTGGYIFKIDKQNGANREGWVSPFPPYPNAPAPILYQYDDPGQDELKDVQKAYIEDLVTRFETFMAQPDIAGYETWIDVDTFVDYLILNEISRNVDGYRLSAFFYKDRDSVDPRIKAGPLWDFNLAFGNANYYNGDEEAGWHVQFQRDNDRFQIPFWWDKLFVDPTFRARISQRWTQLRADVLSTTRLDALIDAYADTLSEAVPRNFARWPVLGQYVWPNAYVGSSFESEISYMKGWIRDRVRWLDGQIAGFVSDPDVPVGTDLGLYPHPVRDRAMVTFGLPQGLSIQVELFNAIGRRVSTVYAGYREAGMYEVPLTDLEGLPSGVYFLRLIAGEQTETRKIVLLSR